MGVKIKQMLVKSRQLTYPGTNGRKYIIVHETANRSKGATARMHAILQANGFTASWHYTVDDLEIWQSFPDTVRCWQAGDGKGYGNYDGIGIEICVNDGANYQKAVDNAVELVKMLMKKHNIPIKNVVQHNKTSSYGKDCPHFLRSGSRKINWSGFIGKISGSSGSANVAGSEKPSKPKAYTYDATYPKLENYGPTVKKVQQMLKQVGYNVAVDSSFGPATDKAVRDFQRKNGLAVDGQAGPATQNALKKAINKKKNSANIAVDGSWGPATTRALQDRFGTTVDGVISGQIQSTSIDNIPSAKVGKGGSNLVRAMQKWLGEKQDGNLGPATITALQRKLGTHPDGYISNPSLAVSEMQHRLNAGTI